MRCTLASSHTIRESTTAPSDISRRSGSRNRAEALAYASAACTSAASATASAAASAFVGAAVEAAVGAAAARARAPRLLVGAKRAPLADASPAEDWGGSAVGEAMAVADGAADGAFGADGDGNGGPAPSAACVLRHASALRVSSTLARGW